MWFVPVAVHTVENCIPDDGCIEHPKHVEHFPDISKLCNILKTVSKATGTDHTVRYKTIL